MNTYVLMDFNERIHNTMSVVTTNCDESTFNEFVGMAHNLGSEEATEVMGHDATACWCDFDYLLLLLNIHGYKHIVVEASVVSW